MHILVTNDDGIGAPGLLALAQAMRTIGEVTVLAPLRNWSVSGHVKTLDRPLRVTDMKLSDGSAALATDGAPGDCVALAAMGFLSRPVDLVVSGINPSPNLGHDVTYSGTVTNAMEAAIWDLPGIAFSLDAGGNGSAQPFDFVPSKDVACRVVKMVLEKGISPGILLSVNIPCIPLEEIKGYRVTRQGRRVYRDVLIRREDPRGVPYYWIGGEEPTGVHELDTDCGALSDGFVSITPLQLDLTAYSYLEKLQNWDWSSPLV